MRVFVLLAVILALALFADAVSRDAQRMHALRVRLGRRDVPQALSLDAEANEAAPDAELFATEAENKKQKGKDKQKQTTPQQNQNQEPAPAAQQSTKKKPQKQQQQAPTTASQTARLQSDATGSASAPAAVQTSSGTFVELEQILSHEDPEELESSPVEAENGKKKNKKQKQTTPDTPQQNKGPDAQTQKDKQTQKPSQQTNSAQTPSAQSPSVQQSGNAVSASGTGAAPVGTGSAAAFLENEQIVYVDHDQAEAHPEELEASPEAENKKGGKPQQQQQAAPAAPQQNKQTQKAPAGGPNAQQATKQKQKAPSTASQQALSPAASGANVAIGTGSAAAVTSFFEMEDF